MFLAMGSASAVDRACALHERAVERLGAGRPRAAATAARRAARLFSAERGLHLDLANVLLALGAAQRELGELALAARTTRRAARLVEREIPSSLDARALGVNAWLQMGDVHVARGAYRQAEEAYRAAGARVSRALGPTFRMPVWNGLGVVCKYTGRFSEGLSHYRRAAVIARKVRDRAAYASLLHNMAGIEHERGRDAAAARLARQGLALRRRLLGPQHPAVAADEAAFAAILAGLGRTAEAKLLCRRAIGTFRGALGPGHAETALALGNLGAVLALEGHTARAERTLRRALSLQVAALGPRHPEVTATRRRLATLSTSR